LSGGCWIASDALRVAALHLFSHFPCSAFLQYRGYSLERRLDSQLKPHKDFRLFLSMETSPKIPVNLLRASRVLMYEQPAGVRANMKDSLSSLFLRVSKPPVEKTRVYLLLSFFHAVVQEWLRYSPSLGWKGFWEFNDSDVSI
jgi:dynein heavy chain 1, cytosolic